MQDQSIFTSSQPRTISEGLQNFIDAMVEEIVLEGKPFDTQKKYLKKFSENEGMVYEKLEADITTFIEILDDLKTAFNKLLVKLAEEKGKECHISDETVKKLLRHLQQPGGFNDLTITANGVSFVMKPVEGGTFQMGGSDSEARDHERPVHNVTVSSFYIGETEVTQAFWESLMGTNPSDFKGENLPVESVGWNDCQEFIRKLNQLTGKNFRLPTEAEWEFAARGGNLSHGYKYAGCNDIDKVAWYGDNSGNKLHAVKLKSPNELGLYDMSGSINEWCLDWYGDYSSGSQTNPQGPSSGLYRVLRGGNWCFPAGCCRVSYRGYSNPGDGGVPILGFRLCLPR